VRLWEEVNTRESQGQTVRLSNLASIGIDGFIRSFNCKQSEKIAFSRYVVLDWITGSKIINRGSGIRMPWVDFSKKWISRARWLFRTQEYFTKKTELNLEGKQIYHGGKIFHFLFKLTALQRVSVTISPQSMNQGTLRSLRWLHLENSHKISYFQSD